MGTATIWWSYDGLRGGWAWTWHPNGIPDNDTCSGQLDGELPPFATDAQLVAEWKKEDIAAEATIDRSDAVPSECWEYYTGFNVACPVGGTVRYFDSEADAREHAEASGCGDSPYLIVARVEQCTHCHREATHRDNLGWDRQRNLPASAPVCLDHYTG